MNLIYSLNDGARAEVSGGYRGAGKAHLSGNVRHLPLPEVPIKDIRPWKGGLVYSIVQMPSGIPVATVAINSTKKCRDTCNREILAVK